MLLRPLLPQRRLVSTISLRSFGNLSLGQTVKHRSTPQRPSSKCTLASQRLVPCRHFSVSLGRWNRLAGKETTGASAVAPSSSESSTSTTENQTERDDVYDKVYTGPLESTFRRLKIFSLASLSLSTALAPFLFVIESSLPPTARLALASIAITTSATSTGMVAWIGKPYVTKLRYIRPEETGGAEGMEMTTVSLMLKPRITTVYDPSFLVETRRPFARWELAQKVVLPKDEDYHRQITAGQEETIAETRDKDGTPLGRWVVTWGENGEGTCRELGHVVRQFNVHEELLP